MGLLPGLRHGRLMVCIGRRVTKVLALRKKHSGRDRVGPLPTFVLCYALARWQVLAWFSLIGVDLIFEFLKRINHKFLEILMIDSVKHPRSNKEMKVVKMMREVANILLLSVIPHGIAVLGSGTSLMK